MKFSTEEKQFLLKLARDSIKSYFEGKNFSISEKDVPSDALKNKLACFVTLTIDSDLRGCIGHLTPIQPLYLDVIENSRAAAFDDPRFLPLTEEEFEKVQIGISVLSLPETFDYRTSEELIDYLEKNKPGVIIQKGPFQATYLPSVWEDINDPKEFLSSLCRKAGLPSNEWQKGELQVQIYNTEKIS